MSQENVEIVRRFFEAVLAENWVEVEGFLAPEAEIHDFDLPDAGVYKGPNSFFDWLAQWDAAWESWEIRDVEIQPASDGRVVVLFTMIARGRDSGLKLERRDAIIFTLRDEEVVRLEYYNEQQKGPALEAAGLRE